MQIYDNNALELSDITIVPLHVSSILSRSNKDLDTRSTLFPNVVLTSPIIASPMKDVCNGKVAKIMRELGGYGIIHRFSSIDEQIEEFKIGQDCGCAIGTNGDYVERFDALYQNGCRNFCLDVANGANISVANALEIFMSMHKDAYFMVGNVASANCFDWLCSLPNVSCIRVGIAGGTACSTRNATGIYQPMASLIDSCVKYNNKAAIIADGGIKEPQDFCKALALGASFIMLGSKIASTMESPAQFIVKDKQYKIYNGSASFEIQKIYKEAPKYIEGKSILLDYKHESIKDVITQFMDGLLSSMSYLNARNLTEYHDNACFSIRK